MVTGLCIKKSERIRHHGNLILMGLKEQKTVFQYVFGKFVVRIGKSNILAPGDGNSFVACRRDAAVLFMKHSDPGILLRIFIAYIFRTILRAVIYKDQFIYVFIDSPLKYGLCACP